MEGGFDAPAASNSVEFGTDHTRRTIDCLGVFAVRNCSEESCISANILMVVNLCVDSLDEERE